MDDLNVILGHVYDPYSDKSSDTSWHSKDGRTLDVSDMADPHLINAINYVKRRYNPSEVAPEGNKMSMMSEDFIGSAGTQLARRFGDCLAHVRSMIDSEKYKHLWAEALKRGLVNEK